MTALLPSRSASLSEQIARTVGRTRTQTRVVGVEHEFGVFDDDTQVDFREWIHDLSVPGMQLHPTNPLMYLTKRGSAVIADGKVAEIATPPICLEPGAATAVADWAEEARKGLIDLLPEHLAIRGGSTHISITTDPATNDRLALLFSRTFATALMLLMDQRNSPGMLVRPRPGRIELCGEFLVGNSLTAATVFAIGAALSVEEHIKGRRGVLPPFLDVSLQRGRRRHGWYVDRKATGVDLYGAGRDAVLNLANGTTRTAQQYLAHAWALARPCASQFATADELADVDSLVAGTTPLPMEAGSYGMVFPVPPRSPHIMGIASTSLKSPEVTLNPSAATWDWVAWQATNEQTSVFVSVPRPLLTEFKDEFVSGGLDQVFEDALADHELLPRLSVASQTLEVGIFASIQKSPALLPVDRYGVGNAPSSSVRLGKRDFPPPSVGFFSTLGTFGSVALGLIAVGLIGLALTFGGLFDETSIAAPTTGAPTTAASAPTTLSTVDECSDSPCGATTTPTTTPVFDCGADVCQDPRAAIETIDPVVFANGELWLVATFADPWTAPPTDLFSFFFGFDLVVDGSMSSVGWEVHDEAVTPLSDNRLLVFGDGSVWAATGISPGSDWSGTVTARSGSWTSPDEQAMFGDWSLEIASGSMLDPALLNDLESTYNLLTGEATEQPIIWMGLTTFFANEFPVNLTGLTTLIDPPGDLSDYYGTLDPAFPDITSVDSTNIQFEETISTADRLGHLTSICDNGFGPGTTTVCPDSLDTLTASNMWAWLDASFSGSGPFDQFGIACTVDGLPTYEGPPSDPNTGRNLTFEVFRSAGYQVGSTAFNGTFDSGPSDAVLAVVRDSGVALIVTSEALAGCSNPTVFMINKGGVDFLGLPSSPAGISTVGEAVTTEAPTTETPTTEAPTATTTPVPEVPTDDAPSTSTTTPIWPYAGSLVALLAGAALYFSREQDTLAGAPPIFEKGTTGQ